MVCCVTVSLYSVSSLCIPVGCHCSYCLLHCHSPALAVLQHKASCASSLWLKLNYAQFTLHCKVYNAHCIMYSVQCTHFSVYYKMYSAQCTVHRAPRPSCPPVGFPFMLCRYPSVLTHWDEPLQYV